MPWLYDRRTRKLWQIASTPVVVSSQGYSGHGMFKDDPEHEDVKDAGPIPGGLWTVAAMIDKTPDHGPYVLRLVPAPGTETFGRSGFLIHGDSITSPGEASLGCIILPRPAREKIWTSGDYNLVVT